MFPRETLRAAATTRERHKSVVGSRRPGMVAMARTLRLLMVTCLTAVVTVLTPATAEASAYAFRPGDPMLDVPKHTETACTGSWAVRGRDGLFFMTAGHCFAKDAPVFGTDAQFGTADRNATGEGQDSMLVKPKAGVDAYQTVVAYK